MNWLAQRFELSRGGSDDNVKPMEGLRGFAVFLVFIVHYTTLVEPWLSKSESLNFVMQSLHTIGHSGVDLFFVLSGYLIYGSLISRKQPFLRFMARRVRRIYPAFVVVFVAYIVLSAVFPSESSIPDGGLEATIYLIQNFLLLPGLFAIEAMITVAWSLSYEMFYYLTIPLIIAVFKLRGWEPRWRIVLFATLAVLVAGYFASFGGPARLLMFVSGILLFEIRKIECTPTLPSLVGLAALAGGLLGTLLPIGGAPGFAGKVSILFVTFLVVCLVCFQNPSGWFSRGFSWTPMRWLGNMSYSYYLLHGLALKGMFLVLSLLVPAGEFPPSLYWVMLPIMFVFTLVPASLLFLLVERPFSLAIKSGETLRTSGQYVATAGSPSSRAVNDSAPSSAASGS